MWLIYPTKTQRQIGARATKCFYKTISRRHKMFSVGNTEPVKRSDIVKSIDDVNSSAADVLCKEIWTLCFDILSCWKHRKYLISFSRSFLFDLDRFTIA